MSEAVKEEIEVTFEKSHVEERIRFDDDNFAITWVGGK